MAFTLFGRKQEKEPVENITPGKISISDPQVVTRLRFLGITEEDLGVINRWHEICQARSAVMIEDFYGHIMKENQTAEIIKKHTTIERQKPMITRYLATMLTGRIDDDYIAYRRTVGKIHDKIDLDSNWFVAMYDVIRRHMVDAVGSAGATQKQKERFTEAFTRLLQVDIAVVITALTDSRQERMEELLRGENARFLAEVSQVMLALGEGDLTVRVRGQYKDENAKAALAFNEAIETLRGAFAEVSDAADQVAAASQQISAASQELATGASSQAAHLEEISASTHELSSLSASNTDRAVDANQVASSAADSAGIGNEAIHRLEGAVQELKQSSERTARIIKTIDEIAFQTNLLALNAAVEAARAGDAGRGFAVVAEEVRSLAIRSAEAAKQTTDIVAASQASATASVAVSAEVVNQFAKINTGIGKVRSMMEEIVAGSQQQRDGSNDMSGALDRINSVTQQTAAASEEAASASTELAGQAASLSAIVGRFKLDDGYVAPVRPHAPEHAAGGRTVASSPAGRAKQPSAWSKGGARK
jgi:methyl-accepting chemotaxis protein